MSQITLCFDFGNTRLKCAVFEGDQLKELIVMENDHDDTIQELIRRYSPSRSILSSVIEHNPAMETALAATTKFHKLNHQSKLPITTPVGKPQDIGADRLAMVAAAVHLFPQKNNLVIGLGTAITYNFINKYHEFVGGSISPGMEMRFKSLHHYTAKLPLVEKDWNLSLIGYDTRTNILSGVILGMAKEIDGIIEYYDEKYTNFNVILTGGDTPFFVYHLKNKIFADPNLIYKGLYAISEHNNV
ncbi:type III pantothenate kinase [Paraflavitalea sp. CAU 1676]|uniref:type III pantothenate kinase n=1 Tax=Paraflavitalea sp. CAU 1676 TaxID=3032598 RepID=UPI0023DBF31B|nr:type III pantothenate kinase [Paraflavitalea sp. CAU 1676]MDF2190807.1 type III pantothenate kinase [Paraflavitalea sp. CAU 1676]